jgi:hypothetical protein
LIFTSAWLLWRLTTKAVPLARKRPFPSDAALLVAALVTGGVAFLLRLVWPVGVNISFLQLGYFASYIALFVAGCAAANGRWLEPIPGPQKTTWLRVAWIALPMFPAVGPFASHLAWLAGTAEGGWNLQALTYAFWEPFVIYSRPVVVVSVALCTSERHRAKPRAPRLPHLHHPSANSRGRGASVA